MQMMYLPTLVAVKYVRLLNLQAKLLCKWALSLRFHFLLRFCDFCFSCTLTLSTTSLKTELIHQFLSNLFTLEFMLRNKSKEEKYKKENEILFKNRYFHPLVMMIYQTFFCFAKKVQEPKAKFIFPRKKGRKCKPTHKL